MKALFQIISNNNLGKRILFHPREDMDLIVMYDNGSNIPVWTLGEDMLKLYYPDVIREDRKIIISGFGGPGFEVSDAYTIPIFELGDGDNRFIFHNLTCAVLNRKNMSANLILSGNIFSGMILTEDRRFQHPFTFSIEADRKDRYIVCDNTVLSEKDKKLLGIAGDEMIVRSTSSFYMETK